MGSIYVHNSTPIIFLSTSQSYILFSKLSNQIESLFFLKKWDLNKKNLYQESSFCSAGTPPSSQQGMTAGYKVEEESPAKPNSLTNLHVMASTTTTDPTVRLSKS